MSKKRPFIKLDVQRRAQRVIDFLKKAYPDAKVALHYNNPLELLVATMLSAQTTDETVNRVTKTLFKKYRSAKDYANSDVRDLEKDIRSTGFYRNKAKNLKNAACMLVEKFNSIVPRTMEELTQLPGVARKTANIVLTNAYGMTEGIAVDTHVRRTSQRLGLTTNKDQNKIEQDLMKIVPKEEWSLITDLLITLGRRVCVARKPRCEICVLNQICPSAFAFD